ncbi:MAG: hypothetical protein CME70_02350 [Halobacteriovorax sp.]|nr:hypothetical protein [Halobacteriovorax sp.]
MKRVFFLIIFIFCSSAYGLDQKRTSVSWQLGPESSSYNLDIGINKSSTIGVHYQQQFAQQKSSNTTYMLNGLYNFGANYEYYLGPDRERFKSGLVLSGGVHYTKLDKDSIHHSINFEGKQEIKPGESLFGARLAASYRLYSESLFGGLGIEASKVGKATIFLPIKLQIGIVF